MPTIRQLRGVNMQGWQPAPAQPQAQPAKAPSPTDTRTQRNPNMLAAMPLVASTNDALQRQFYGGKNVPTYRILPATGGQQ